MIRLPSLRRQAAISLASVVEGNAKSEVDDTTTSALLVTVIGVVSSNQFYTAQTTYSISPLPLPAAAWLFISAIAGLAGAKRLSRSKGSA